jgi:hypothetical protein
LLSPSFRHQREIDFAEDSFSPVPVLRARGVEPARELRERLLAEYDTHT